MIIKDKKTGKEKDVRLPKAFKKKWLEALRSGEFEQGKGCLNQGREYCCLGVACRIASPRKNLGSSSFITQKLSHHIKVPKIIKGWGGLPEKLATMNDQGKSFKQIANWIEKNL